MAAAVSVGLSVVVAGLVEEFSSTFLVSSTFIGLDSNSGFLFTTFAGLFSVLASTFAGAAGFSAAF